MGDAAQHALDSRQDMVVLPRGIKHHEIHLYSLAFQDIFCHSR
jgi:hypothetical protein